MSLETGTLEKKYLQEARWPWQKEIFLQLQYVPWIMLERDLNSRAAFEEALRLLPRFVSHRAESQAGTGRWKGLALKSADGSLTQTTLPPAGEACDFSLTEIAALCPATLRLLESITDISQCERIRFMLLEPGAEIIVHSDAPDKPTSLALNIALNMPKGCEFWVDLDPSGKKNLYSHSIPIESGCAFLFNSSTYHRVVNHSGEPRIHLIAHGPIRYSDRELIEKSRQQNHTRDLRHLVNLLIRKKLESGKQIPEDDPVRCDYMNLGALTDFLPENVRLALVERPTADASLDREARLVTAAGLNNIPHELLSFPELTAWLERQRQSGGKTAVIMAAGTQILDPTNFVMELWRKVSWMRREGIPLAGHILRKKGWLPRIHEQFFLLDLETWKSAGSPSFEFPSEGETATFPAHEASAECIHDDYTPLWLSGRTGEEIQGRPGFGTGPLAAFLKAGHTVHNISLELRAQKDFMYPEEGRGEDYRRIKERINVYLEEKKNRVYVFNTEPMRVEDFAFSPNVLISPCSGLKPLSLMQQFSLRTSDARFLFLDKNENALSYYQKLVSCSSYAEVLDLQEAELVRQHLLPPEGRPYLKRMMDSVTEELFSGSKSELLSHLKALNVASTFAQVDYLNEPEKILDFLAPCDRVLFWHSNVWEYTAAFYERSASELRQNYLYLVNRFSQAWGLPAWVHQESYKAVLGEEFQRPRIVLTQGGSKRGKPSERSFRLFKEGPTRPI